MAINIKLIPSFLKFQSTNSNYRIYCANVIDGISIPKNETISIVGEMPALVIGKEYMAVVEKKEHPRYGTNFEIYTISPCDKDCIDDELNLLQCFVTPKQFENISNVYSFPISAIQNNTFDWKLVRGLSEKSYHLLASKIIANVSYFKAITELSKYGLGFELIKKCVLRYGGSEQAIATIQKNPYTLYTDISGIGWKRADEIALALGISLHSQNRIEAAIYFSIDSVNNGSTYFSLNEIKERTEEALGFDFSTIEQFADIVKSSAHLYTDGTVCAIEKHRKCEENISNKLREMLCAPMWNYANNECLNDAVARNEQKLGLHYTATQKTLFEKLNANNIVVLTGYAGTGKSRSLCGLLDILDSVNVEYSLCAPTGKAAQQIENYTNRTATTIHRLLGIMNDKWWDADKIPLTVFSQVLIIDEFSMVDIHLFNTILSCLSPNTKLLLIGDPKQLSAVGLGNCLKDIIESGKVPIIQLTEVFRQALDNGSLQLATAVRQGKIIFDTNKEINTFGVNQDCIVWYSKKDEAVKNVLKLYDKLLQRYKISDIVVISPVRKNGTTSVNYLNSLLQEYYNPNAPNKATLEIRKAKYRVGDKVIHIKNNYAAVWLDSEYQETNNCGVFNGNIGTIVKIDIENKILYVQYDNYIIQYQKDMFSELELAYAITTHKMQGSSAKVIIYIINSNSNILNNRNNIYTALTRTTDKSFILAEYEAFVKGISKEESNNRNTFLKNYLNKGTNVK